MNVLVTGGAGYIGSIVAERLLEQDHRVIILDNLSQGHREAILPVADFVQADVVDAGSLHRVFESFKIDAVVHMAAESVVNFSLSDPQRYFRTNVVGGINLLDVMLKHDVKDIVFSSSAAVYGEPQKIPIEEDHPIVPVNAYGETKLMFEKLLQWYGKAYGIRHVSLRYFNAAGASKRFGEYHCPETHLIPSVLRVALDNHSSVSIFGTDYSTQDGSCVRDYVHVLDIAQAHILALHRIDEACGGVFNLGSGRGCSVLQVVKIASRVTGSEIPVVFSPRRAGDPAVLLASSSRAEAQLGWKPEFSKPEVIIESAWEWLKGHPEGYSRKKEPQANARLF